MDIIDFFWLIFLMFTNCLTFYPSLCIHNTHSVEPHIYMSHYFDDCPDHSVITTVVHVYTVLPLFVNLLSNDRQQHIVHVRIV